MEPKSVSQEHITSSQGPWKTILITGSLAGTLDALGAIIIYQANPAQMFRFIASGVFGAGSAFSGGSIMVAWGVSFHYLIAFFWTILFFFMYPALPVLWRNKYITGLMYGLFVWLVMNKVVLPLSAIPQGPFSFAAAVTGASILMVAIGLPIALLTHRYYSRKGMLRGDS